MSVDYEWGEHVPGGSGAAVELLRLRGRWNERDHPRDSEGKFARGQRVKVPGAMLKTGKRRMHTGEIASRADSEGNYTVRVDNGVNGRRVKYHHSQIEERETRGRARARQVGAAAGALGIVAANHYVITGQTPVGAARAGVGAVRDANARRKNDKAFRQVMKANGFKPGRAPRPNGGGIRPRSGR